MHEIERNRSQMGGRTSFSALFEKRGRHHLTAQQVVFKTWINIVQLLRLANVISAQK